MRLQVATRKGLFVYDLSGAEPSLVGRHFLGINVSLSHADDRSGRWYAALEHGHFGVKLHRSQDGGQTWSEIGVPTYPKRAPGAVTEQGADGRDFRGTSRRSGRWSLVGLRSRAGCGARHRSRRSVPQRRPWRPLAAQ